MATGVGRLRLLTVQPEGKPAMAAAAWRHGAHPGPARPAGGLTAATGVPSEAMTDAPSGAGLAAKVLTVSDGVVARHPRGPQRARRSSSS